ncbi:hypothetical protein V1525DRAFT_384865 [Lipomyces kononenkoae]|uniref:Uncharacterized protein n=1 Tax=Lipomyces kononenkoae TaxID=34357 RepID=A0ACC3TBW8_LIPKO
MEPVQRNVGVAAAVVLVLLLSILISLRLRRIRHGAGLPTVPNLQSNSGTERRMTRHHLGIDRRGTDDVVAVDLQQPYMQQEMSQQFGFDEQSYRGMPLPRYEQHIRHAAVPPTYEEAVQRQPDECENSGTNIQVNGPNRDSSNVARPERALSRERVSYVC